MNKIFSRMQNLESSKKFKSAKNSRGIERCLYFLGVDFLGFDRDS